MVGLYLACAASGSLLFPMNRELSAGHCRSALLEANPVASFYDKPYQSIVDQLRAVVDAQTWVYWEPGRESGYEELLCRPLLAVSTGGTMGIPKSAVHKQFSYAACTLNYFAAARIAPTDVQHSGEFGTWDADGYTYLAERAKNGMRRKLHSAARPKNQHVC